MQGISLVDYLLASDNSSGNWRSLENHINTTIETQSQPLLPFVTDSVSVSTFHSSSSSSLPHSRSLSAALPLEASLLIIV